MAEFWQEPLDLPDRDLFAGPWGLKNAPDPNEIFTVSALKTSGTNPGLVVSDGRGREWHVKQGSEGQPEVIVSRRVASSLRGRFPLSTPAVFQGADEKRLQRGIGRARLSTETLKKPASGNGKTTRSWARRPTETCWWCSSSVTAT
jgi:hypothetical protein